MTEFSFTHKPVTSPDLEVFSTYKKSIDKEVRNKYPSIPASFELKPVLVRHVSACATIHEYKLALPENKFVKISFRTGGLQVYRPGEARPKQPREPTISVDDTLTSTAEE